MDVLRANCGLCRDTLASWFETRGHIDRWMSLTSCTALLTMKSR
jgi:hypothetical protein